MNKQKLKQMFEREGYKEILEEEYDNRNDSMFVVIDRKGEHCQTLFFIAPKNQKYESGNLEAVWNSRLEHWDLKKGLHIEAGYITRVGGIDLDEVVEVQHLNNIIEQMKKDGVFEK